MRDLRLHLALTAALAAGMAMGCRTSTAGPVPTASAPETPSTPNDQPVSTQVVRQGLPPADLEALCKASAVEGFNPAEPVDSVALRSTSDTRDPRNTQRAAWGEPCKGASDRDACAATLAETWPSSSGYGYCGMGCTDQGLVFTRGDVVGLVDSKDEAVAFFGPIDTVAEALHLTRTVEYSPRCQTVTALADGGYELEATIDLSDCPFTSERRLLAVSPDGTITARSVLEHKVGGGCAGRRPDGLQSGSGAQGDATARHLAHLAHLEAAAVIAFERLALDLERIGAPAELSRRAREAAQDEVRHARLMSAAARAIGGEPAPVQVSPHDTRRTLLDLAIENAVEGCVRETYGVVDALYRAEHAPTPALRTLFADIATDEARHSELSWDIHRWMLGKLCCGARLQVLERMSAAHDALHAELAIAHERRVQQGLGAPDPQTAQRMAAVLRRLQDDPS